jgi:hypothetical protein
MLGMGDKLNQGFNWLLQQLSGSPLPAFHRQPLSGDREFAVPKSEKYLIH